MFVLRASLFDAASLSCPTCADSAVLLPVSQFLCCHLASLSLPASCWALMFISYLSGQWRRRQRWRGQVVRGDQLLTSLPAASSLARPGTTEMGLHLRRPGAAAHERGHVRASQWPHDERRHLASTKEPVEPDVIVKRPVLSTKPSVRTTLCFV